MIAGMLFEMQARNRTATLILCCCTSIATYYLGVIRKPPQPLVPGPSAGYKARTGVNLCSGSTSYSPDCGDFGSLGPSSQESRLPISNAAKKRKEEEKQKAVLSIQDTALKEALKLLQPGRLAYSIPPEMKTGHTEIVMARIGSADIPINALTLGMSQQQGAVLGLENTKVSLHMMMALKGDDFTISPQSTSDQLVGGDEPTTWQWQVMPKHRGTLHLHLSATVMLGTLKQDYTTVDKDIAVTVDGVDAVQKFCQNNWKWILSTLGAIVVFLVKLTKPPDKGEGKKDQVVRVPRRRASKRQ